MEGELEPFPLPFGGWDPLAMRPVFGTYRGWVRLLLARGEQISGRLAGFQSVDWPAVERLVFVCRGNVCRSAYAAAIAAKQGFASASFGVSASTGATASPAAIRAAGRRGIDIEGHRACDMRDFEFRSGDLLATMEIRQGRQLLDRARPGSVQVTLLGNWSRPRRPHIHDPHRLSDEYLEHCFDIIDSAVERMITAAGGR